jgi:macrolide-specific efflux system membrane fusion protein
LKRLTQNTLLIAVLAITVSLGVTACKSKKKAKNGSSFKTAQVTRGSLSISVKSTGNVQPQNRLAVTPPLAGRVEKMLVTEGEYVKKGQVLAYLSSSERAALLDAARAKGPEEVAHWEELYKATPLLAPMSGQVINRAVEPGQTVGSGDTVVVLSDYLIVDAQVDETDIGRVKVGQKATLTLDAYPNQTIPARVSQIRYEAKTVNNVTMYEVYVLPKRVPNFMRSGMTADVEFNVDGKEGALLLPSEAIQSSEGKSFVLLKGEKGVKPEKVTIETGITDGSQTEIVSGLAEGDTVLIPSLTLEAAGDAESNPFMPKRPGSGGATQRRGASGGGGGFPH